MFLFVNIGRVLYSQKYLWGIKFVRLAFYEHTTKFKFAKYFLSTNVKSSVYFVNPVTTKFISTNFDFPPFSRELPW